MKGLTWPGFSGEARTIPGVPSPAGGYTAGAILPLSDTGMTEDEAKAAIKGTPLKLVDTSKTKGGE